MDVETSTEVYCRLTALETLPDYTQKLLDIDKQMLQDQAAANLRAARDDDQLKIDAMWPTWEVFGLVVGVAVGASALGFLFGHIR